ncbi:MAG: hypothetical protein JXM79_18585 [Sedimentisphaerales bacterium]|nr:hypothetical protein [Sedimentisphaerales bacterium]
MTPKEFELKRRRQIKKLLDASTKEEKQRIREVCREGQRLRQELENMQL